jgi:hypothetical protein
MLWRLEFGVVLLYGGVLGTFIDWKSDDSRAGFAPGKKCLQAMKPTRVVIAWAGNGGHLFPVSLWRRL